MFTPLNPRITAIKRLVAFCKQEFGTSPQLRDAMTLIMGMELRQQQEKLAKLLSQHSQDQDIHRSARENGLDEVNRRLAVAKETHSDVL